MQIMKYFPSRQEAPNPEVIIKSETSRGTEDFNSHQILGMFYLVNPSEPGQAKEVIAIQMMIHGEDKFAPAIRFMAHGEGIIVSARALAKLDAK